MKRDAWSYSDHVMDKTQFGDKYDKSIIPLHKYTLA